MDLIGLQLWATIGKILSAITVVGGTYLLIRHIYRDRVRLKIENAEISFERFKGGQHVYTFKLDIRNPSNKSTTISKIEMQFPITDYATVVAELTNEYKPGLVASFGPDHMLESPDHLLPFKPVRIKDNDRQELTLKAIPTCSGLAKYAELHIYASEGVYKRYVEIIGSRSNRLISKSELPK